MKISTGILAGGYLLFFAVCLFVICAIAQGCTSCPARDSLPPSTASIPATTRPIDPRAQGSPINDTLGIDTRCWNSDWCNVTTCTEPKPGEYPMCTRTAMGCMRPSSCPQ
jgi:hypothetical protein